MVGLIYANQCFLIEIVKLGIFSPKEFSELVFQIYNYREYAQSVSLKLINFIKLIIKQDFENFNQDKHLSKDINLDMVYTSCILKKLIG